MRNTRFDRKTILAFHAGVIDSELASDVPLTPGADLILPKDWDTVKYDVSLTTRDLEYFLGPTMPLNLPPLEEIVNGDGHNHANGNATAISPDEYEGIAPYFLTHAEARDGRHHKGRYINCWAIF